MRGIETVNARLLSAAKLLYANCEGCVVNHYPADYAEMGLPGWLIDCAKDIASASSAPEKSADKTPTAFHFDRYINGELMAEGVTIERQSDLPSAMRQAVKLAARGPWGEYPVLVYREGEIA